MESTKGFTLQDILLLVGFQERTGELVLESGNNIGSLLVHNGMILHAFSPYSRAIGDLMVDNGVISEGELLEALKDQKKNPDIPLGMMLMRTGKVDFALIEKMVQEQIRKAIDDFATWESLTFTFIAKDVIPFDRIQVPIGNFIQPETVKSALDFLKKGLDPLSLSRAGASQAQTSSNQ